MKSKERHELQTSELQKIATRIGPFFENYGRYILYAACVLLVVGIGALWWIASSGKQNAAAWAQFLNSENAEEYAVVAEDHPTTSVAYWARLRSAEQNLRQGVRNLFFKRDDEGDSRLAEARTTLESLLQDPSTPEPVRERATILLAQCVESMPDRKKSEQHVAQARKLYEQFAKEFPQSVYADYARSRAATLAEGHAADFYAYFDAAEPRLEEEEAFNPNAPTRPPAPVTLPAIPEELQLPGTADDELELPELNIPKPDSTDSSANESSETAPTENAPKEDPAKDEEGAPRSEP